MIVAIGDNDTAAAMRLLRQGHDLASRLIQSANLYDSGIFHWIYAGDSLLHLAAAGYRVADSVQSGWIRELLAPALERRTR